MNNKACKNCAYFRQHYTFDQRRIFRVYCGHCVFGRPRQKKPDTTACSNYSPCTPQEDAFVSKEYLSKELLRYMLNLELLPEIDSAECPNFP